MFSSLSYTKMLISIALVLVHCLPTNYGNHVVRFLIFYYCTKYCLYQSFHYSELQEHASSHCSLLRYGKGIVY